jgi:hypothetical protein
MNDKLKEILRGKVVDKSHTINTGHPFVRRYGFSGVSVLQSQTPQEGNP